MPEQPPPPGRRLIPERLRAFGSVVRAFWSRLHLGATGRRARQIAIRLRTPAAVLGVVVIAVISAGVAVAFLGPSKQSVGPVETTMRLLPSVHGDSVLELPPLGTLALDSHDGPLGLDVAVNEINQRDAQRIFDDPQSLNGLPGGVTTDLRKGVYATATRGLLVGVVAAAVVGLVVVRRRWAVFTAAGTAAVVILGAYGIAALTWNPRAVTELRYTGLLTSAPSMVGTAYDIAENLDDYTGELVRLVTNVTKLYDVTSTLPAYQPDENVVRILHVADLHLNEYSWDIVASVVNQYKVDLIVDSGDTTDHGLAAENFYLQRIATLGVPYVWVRGNHDSMVTQRGMEELPNAVVLDGKIEEVKGIRFLGGGDPRFTPDRSHRDIPSETEAVAAQAIALAKIAKNSQPPVDIMVYHDSAGAAFFDGNASFLLTGHGHERINNVLPNGSRLMQEGSTGGAGLRALEKDEPAPIEMSVLYLDRLTRDLDAWDEITLGGLGLTSAQIERHHVDPEREETTTPSPVPTPSEELESPLSTPTITAPPSEWPTTTPPPSSSSSPGTTPAPGETTVRPEDRPRPTP